MSCEVIKELFGKILDTIHDMIVDNIVNYNEDKYKEWYEQDMKPIYDLQDNMCKIVE